MGNHHQAYVIHWCVCRGDNVWIATWLVSDLNWSIDLIRILLRAPKRRDLDVFRSFWNNNGQHFKVLHLTWSVSQLAVDAMAHSCVLSSSPQHRPDRMAHEPSPKKISKFIRGGSAGAISSVYKSSQTKSDTDLERRTSAVSPIMNRTQKIQVSDQIHILLVVQATIHPSSLC